MKTIHRTTITGHPVNPGKSSVLGQRWFYPPFSSFNAREGFWQDRKRQWLSLGIQSEIGRGDNLLKFSEQVKLNSKNPYDSVSYRDQYKLDAIRNSKYKAQSFNIDRHDYPARPGGGTSTSVKKSVWLNSPVGGDEAINSKSKYKNNLTFGIGIHDYDSQQETLGSTGTSIFDPVLCEIIYKWFCAKNGLILDPFAGGSVRGIVASVLGYDYIGVDLRPEQIEANEIQAQAICENNQPMWIEGDSRDLQNLLPEDLKVDFIMSCPPYFDLEKYSGDDRDLSNTTWEQFCDDYTRIIHNSVSFLADNSFACFVIGDIRDKKGMYKGLPNLTVEAFEYAGMNLYNECILITAVGSLPLRIHKQFSKSRKLGRSHQSVLIFVKGNPTIASSKCAEISPIG